MARRAICADAMNADENTRNTDDRTDSGIDRRNFLAVGGALATTLVAGCAGGNSGGSTTTTESTGSFRLFVSDQPVAIDEFDSLDVTIDGGRLFRADETEEGSETTETTTEATAAGNETATTTNETTTDATNETESEATETTSTDDDSDADQDGFVEIDVDDETVDLTTVLGEKAIGVFDGEVPTGRYSSVHLSVTQVEGSVDGEAVDVKLPSERLKITKPFEVSEDEPLEFVFDITVVKKGQSGGYNLLPVIGESGVVGKDVEMQEVEQSQADDTGANETTETTAD